MFVIGLGQFLDALSVQASRGGRFTIRPGMRECTAVLAPLMTQRAGSTSYGVPERVRNRRVVGDRTKQLPGVGKKSVIGGAIRLSVDFPSGI